MINIKFKHSICPLVFRNTSFQVFVLNDQIKTFYRQNLLQFSNLNKSLIDVDLGISINEAYFENFIGIDLDERFLNPQVFKSIVLLSLRDRLNSIQPELFRSFKNLKNVQLGAIIWKQFVHQQGISWIKELNSDVKIIYESNKQLANNSKERLILIGLIDFYGLGLYAKFSLFKDVFPEEDFCLYISFPFDQLIVLLLNQGVKQGKPTCTFLWVIQYLEWFLDLPLDENILIQMKRYITDNYYKGNHKNFLILF